MDPPPTDEQMAAMRVPGLSSGPPQKGPPRLVEIFPDAVKKAEELLRSEQSLAASIKKIVLEILLLLTLIWGVVGLTFFFFEPDPFLLTLAWYGSAFALVWYGLDRITEEKIGITDEDIQAVLKASAERDLRRKRKVAWKVNRNTILWALWAPALFGLLRCSAAWSRAVPSSSAYFCRGSPYASLTSIEKRKNEQWNDQNAFLMPLPTPLKFTRNQERVRRSIEMLTKRSPYQSCTER